MTRGIIIAADHSVQKGTVSPLHISIDGQNGVDVLAFTVPEGMEDWAWRVEIEQSGERGYVLLGDDLAWTVRAGEVTEGEAILQVVASKVEDASTLVWKSREFSARVLPAINAGEAVTPEDATQLDKIAAQVAADAEAAAGSAQIAKEAADMLSGLDAEAETLPAGSDATVTVVDGKIVYGIPRGDTGAQGPQGERGPQGGQGPQGPAGADGVQADDTAVSTESTWSSRHIVDMLCPPLEASGNPVTCTPVAGYPLEVKAAWQPRQAGTGDPYPPGGGANLLDMAMCTPIDPIYMFGMTCEIDGDVVTISGVPNIETEGPYSFGIILNSQTELRGHGYVITPFAIEGTIQSAWGLRTADEANIAMSATLYPGVENTIKLRLTCSQNALTEYAPYSNIRPISGMDEVTVQRSGKNLMPYTKPPESSYTSNGVTFTWNDDGSIHVSGTAVGRADSKVINFDGFYLPPGAYRMIPSSQSGVIPQLVVKKGGTRTNIWYPPTGVSIENGDVPQYFYVSVADGATVDTTIYAFLSYGSELPSTEDYAPYTGTTATLSLPETIYGGTVDAVSGVGSAQYIYRELAISDMDNSENFPGWNNVPWINDVKHNPAPDGVFAALGIYGVTNIANVLQGNFWNINGTQVYTLPEFWGGKTQSQIKEAYPDLVVQFCLQLVTPTPFQATGAQSLPALSGENVLTTNADSLTVTGRADPTHTIQALTDRIAALETAAVEGGTTT